MEVSYTTTLDDHVAYCMYTLRKSKMARNAFLQAWLFLPALSVLVALALIASRGLSVIAGLCVGGAGLYVAAYPIFYFRWIERFARKRGGELGARGVIGPIRLILSEDSLVEITEVTRTEARWRDMHGIVEDGDYTFILVTGLAAAIIPRHCFQDETDYFRVRDFARARIRTNVNFL